MFFADRLFAQPFDAYTHKFGPDRQSGGNQYFIYILHKPVSFP